MEPFDELRAGLQIGDHNVAKRTRLRAPRKSLRIVNQYNYGPLFTPPEVVGTPKGKMGTVYLPGTNGGADWGGGAKCELPLAEGSYRARYCAKRFGEAPEGNGEDGEELVSYAVARAAAGVWHACARGSTNRRSARPCVAPARSAGETR